MCPVCVCVSENAHTSAGAAQAPTIPAGAYVKLAPGADSLPECSEGPLKPGVYGEGTPVCCLRLLLTHLAHAGRVR